jgi:hypothetical protein
MSLQDTIARTAANKKRVLSSPILAKAAVRLQDGTIRILAVYHLSTRYEFYWIHKVKSPRSPRKAWREIHRQARDLNIGDKPYDDFRSFVDHYARIQRAEVLSVRVHKARRLAQVLEKTDHESLTTDWDNPHIIPTVQNTQLINKKFQRKLKGSNGW